MNKFSQKSAHTVTELASARQHQKFGRPSWSAWWRVNGGVVVALPCCICFIPRPSPRPPRDSAVVSPGGGWVGSCCCAGIFACAWRAHGGNSRLFISRAVLRRCSRLSRTCVAVASALFRAYSYRKLCATFPLARQRWPQLRRRRGVTVASSARHSASLRGSRGTCSRAR